MTSNAGYPWAQGQDVGGPQIDPEVAQSGFWAPLAPGKLGFAKVDNLNTPYL